MNLAPLIREGKLCSLTRKHSLSSRRSSHLILLGCRNVFIDRCEHPVVCLTTIVTMSATSIVTAIKGVTATYLCAWHVIICGRHSTVLHHSVLSPFDFFLEFVEIIEEDFPCLFVQRIVILCLLFDLQVIELKIKALLLIFLVLHCLDVLNIVTNTSVVRALILISHERKGLCEGTWILMIFKSKVFQRNHIVLYVIVGTTCWAARIQFCNDESSRLRFFLISITVLLWCVESFNHLVRAVWPFILFLLFRWFMHLSPSLSRLLLLLNLKQL